MAHEENSLEEGLLGDGGSPPVPVDRSERAYFPPPTPLRRPLCARVVRWVTSPSFAIRSTICLNAPQILGALVVLTMHYCTSMLDTATCNKAAEEHWRTWAILCAIRTLLSTYVAVRRYHLTEIRQLDDSSRPVRFYTNVRNTLDAVAVIWFIIGNLWVFGVPEYMRCGFYHSAMFWLCVSMIVIQYIQLCVPVIVAAMLVPVFCCCMSCFVRFLATVHDPMEGRGADIKAINQLPVITYRDPRSASGGPSDLVPILNAGSSPPTCPICLGDFIEGDKMRCLPCKHMFHQTCCDQWLLVNATCPNCRENILGDDGSEASDD